MLKNKKRRNGAGALEPLYFQKGRLSRTHSDRLIQPYGFTMKQWIFNDMLCQLGILRRLAEAFWKRNLLN